MHLFLLSFEKQDCSQLPQKLLCTYRAQSIFSYSFHELDLIAIPCVLALLCHGALSTFSSCHVLAAVFQYAFENPKLHQP